MWLPLLFFHVRAYIIYGIFFVPLPTHYKTSTGIIMNISTQIAQAVVTGIKTLYGQEVTIDSVQLQETRPEFEGNMTLVVFPYLKMWP